MSRWTAAWARPTHWETQDNTVSRWLFHGEGLWAKIGCECYRWRLHGRVFVVCAVLCVCLEYVCGRDWSVCV